MSFQLSPSTTGGGADASPDEEPERRHERTRASQLMRLFRHARLELGVSAGLAVVCWLSFALLWSPGPRLWVWVLLVTVAFLAIAVAINYGPF